MGEKYRVAFTSRVDTNVIFGVGRVGKERLNDKVSELTSSSLNLA